MTVTVTTQVCDLPPFKGQVTPQDPPTANSIELVRDEIERYLALLSLAACADLTSLGARVEECCEGGGTTDLVAREMAEAAQTAADDAQATADTALSQAQAAQSELDIYTNIESAETVIGQWIGDETLYRKVIAIAAGPNNTTLNTAHNITGLTRVIHQHGYLYRSSTSDSIPLPYVHESVLIRMSVSGANIVLFTTGNFSAFTGHVTLVYLK